MKSGMKVLLSGLCLFYCLFIRIDPAFTDEVSELKSLVSTLVKRVEELEEKVATYEAKDKQNQMNTAQVEDRLDAVSEELSSVKTLKDSGSQEFLGGLEIGVGLTSVYQFTDNANGDNLSQHDENVNDATWSMDLELSKTFEDIGSAFILLEAGQGAGVDEELAVFSPVNFDATGGDGNVGVVEAWYEHYIGDSTLTFGKLDGTVYIDTNAYANDEAGQFLGNMFRNNPTVQFPSNGAGLRLGQVLNDQLDLDVIIMDGDGDWEDVMDGPFVAGQVNIKPELMDRLGNYRFYGCKTIRGLMKPAQARILITGLV